MAAMRISYYKRMLEKSKICADGVAAAEMTPASVYPWEQIRRIVIVWHSGLAKRAFSVKTAEEEFEPYFGDSEAVGVRTGVCGRKRTEGDHPGSFGL